MFRPEMLRPKKGIFVDFGPNMSVAWHRVIGKLAEKLPKIVFLADKSVDQCYAGKLGKLHVSYRIPVLLFHKSPGYLLSVKFFLPVVFFLIHKLKLNRSWH